MDKSLLRSFNVQLKQQKKKNNSNIVLHIGEEM